ncbi:MAG: U32 family peptidase, partial [Planctomycetes bacterium]|nr:U32 family peptidase [Planctomycetota bacterium]
MAHSPELLAPAGQPDAGYAALEYGADAVYLGLDRFSARAEAVNFTPDQLAVFTAYAHSLSRRVYLTLNTLVQQKELPAATATLLTAAECGVDGVIVQDAGVARLVRERFPTLRLHASTQMAIHSPAGVAAAARLGFHRVTLARELDLDAIRTIAAGTDLEIECFIHGTLCYSYSGLCLFSSLVHGRSGNRGRCAYTCREAAATSAGPVHPFSLKDLALGERAPDLVRAGVASIKIEGRKKSPLYVAATVDYYRKLLDGRLSPEAAARSEARLKTIFARPWTRLFLDRGRPGDAADPLVVGHRGSRIGTVERLLRTPAGPGFVFTPDLPVERHDGLQIDLPDQPRPYGFGVDHLYRLAGNRPAPIFAGDAGQPLAVALPADAPALRPGLPLYLSASQAVKREFTVSNPKPDRDAGQLPA